MSPIRTGTPLGVVRTTMLSISAGIARLPADQRQRELVIVFDQARRIDHVALRDRVENAGHGHLRPASSLAGSGSIWNSGTLPPCSTTMETPFTRLRRGLMV